MPRPDTQRRAGAQVCPRCGADLSSIDGVCSNTRCSWPNPEPGTITALRWRLRGRADSALQRLREVGRWPRLP